MRSIVKRMGFILREEIRKEYCFLLIRGPKHYRVNIWGKRTPEASRRTKLIKFITDKDFESAIRRARTWIDAQ